MNTLCPVCQEGELEVSRENYRYTESGLPNVTLENIEVSHCAACGERIVSIARLVLRVGFRVMVMTGSLLLLFGRDIGLKNLI